MPTPAEIPFQQLLEALLDIDKPLDPRYLYRLSDLDTEELASLEATWLKLPTWRRKALMEDVQQLGERNTLLSYEALGRFALKDSDAQVRTSAVRTLWEFEVSTLIPVFLDLMETDPDSEVRVAAASGLGHFIYMGEVGEFSPKILRQIEDRLLRAVNSKDEPGIRRAALESLGYSSRKEVPSLIETAYYSNIPEWIASALFAMGRSANKRWSPIVIAMLANVQPGVRSEAARAAGALELHQAVPRLLELLDDPDEDTCNASIWSLSQLGGDGVREALEKVAEEIDDEVGLAFLEEALDNLSFTEDMQLMPLIDLYEEEEEDDSDWLEEDEGDED